MVHEFISKILKKEQLLENIYLITLSCPKDFTFKNGQFIKIYFDSKNNNSEKKFRFYSINSSPNNKESIDLVIKIYEKGFASQIFENSKIGDEFLISGPYGLLTLKQDESNKKNSNNYTYIMIAAGTGIVPFHSIINDYIHKGLNIKLFYSAKTRSELLFNEVFSNYESKYDNFEYNPIITREEKKIHIQDILSDKEFNDPNEIFYICGIRNFVFSIKEFLLSKNISEDRIIIESYN